ncbi:MAG TPA: CPBP family intramembrane glutamic endopeptidase [Nocardioidaceae bacterium]|nr:CPBP family intramembrane glutamic endopeptidase [Nocardioidaceae bacterium]
MSSGAWPPPGPSAGHLPVPPTTQLPAAAWRFPHAEPTPYHLMLRTWTYAWWRPVVGVLLAVVSFFVAASVVYLAVAAVAALFGSGAYLDDFERQVGAISSGDVGPESLLALNLGLASMIPITWLLMRWLHRMRPRWLASVVPRFRWRFFAVCLGVAVVALLAQVLVGLLLPAGSEDDLSGAVNDFTVRTALTALVVLASTPLQAAGEEYLFRGYLLQAFGSLFRSRWVAVVGTALLFAIAHGSQNFPLFFDRFAFGLIAGWLVTRTGGLEAGIALHILNNFLAFGFALAFGDIGSALAISEVSWWNILLTVTQSGVYTLLVVWVARRMSLQTATRPPSDGPAESPGPAVAAA